MTMIPIVITVRPFVQTRAARLCRTAATRRELSSLILKGWVVRTMGIIMRKIAIGLAALTIATAGSTLTASALPGGGSLDVVQSIGHGDNIDKVFWRGRGFHRGFVVHRRFGRFGRVYGFHPGFRRGFVARRWWW